MRQHRALKASGCAAMVASKLRRATAPATRLSPACLGVSDKSREPVLLELELGFEAICWRRDGLTGLCASAAFTRCRRRQWGQVTIVRVPLALMLGCTPWAR